MELCATPRSTAHMKIENSPKSEIFPESASARVQLRWAWHENPLVLEWFGSRNIMKITTEYCKGGTSS
ncbi:hypothetical protein I7I50_00889 [Histoplasma capsulatum G186AR]|uniref:Uncharacterized protein n=1 Tax=Ajellomyces capsulatus TaxID=5037 RepID=A0A8H8CW54_AJECA|nr:hypothetical protein I7I52_08155 [Histoplasma capsulatum]QSS72901.1 hypothetical protein I7I50_00889 [Histoplasma capsulatum G186AR]